MTEWTRREDKAPPVGEQVLAVVEAHGLLLHDIVSRRKRGGYWALIAGGLTDGQVTHWMALPALPKRGVTEGEDAE